MRAEPEGITHRAKWWFFLLGCTKEGPRRAGGPRKLGRNAHSLCDYAGEMVTPLAMDLVSLRFLWGHGHPNDFWQWTEMTRCNGCNSQIIKLPAVIAQLIVSLCS